jgi:hypothetical protein
MPKRPSTHVTPSEFLARLKACGISQREFARQARITGSGLFYALQRDTISDQLLHALAQIEMVAALIELTHKPRVGGADLRAVIDLAHINRDPGHWRRRVGLQRAAKMRERQAQSEIGDGDSQPPTPPQQGPQWQAPQAWGDDAVAQVAGKKKP